MERGVTLPLTPVEFGILCALALLAGLIWWSLSATRHDDRRNARERSNPERLLEMFTYFLTPVWGALVLFVLYLMWRIGERLTTLGAGEELRWYALGFVGLVTALGGLVSAPLALIRVATTERQTRTAEQGHMTDRISKAVEHLGAEKTVKKIVTDQDGKPATQETSEPNLEVRIGGLLSLERIAQDSTAYDKGRDHVRVMEIICAYIRHNAPASMARDFPPGDLEPLAKDAGVEQRNEHLAQIETRSEQRRSWLATLPTPREDVALALLILERRSDRQRRIEAAHGQDGVAEAEWVFAEPCPRLSDAPKDQPHPPGAVDAFKTQLGAWKERLRSYRGYRPDLRDTCLQRAALSGFRLGGVRLDRARMEGADLFRARMEGANLSSARMEGANLLRARMEGADLFRARMEGANLLRARMEGADLFRARMEGADLWEARMEGADLWEARMDSETDLRAADFPGSALRSVDFTSVGISQAQVNASFGDGSAILPETLSRPGHWPGWKMDYDDFDAEWRRFCADPDNYRPPRPPDSTDG